MAIAVALFVAGADAAWTRRPRVRDRRGI